MSNAETTNSAQRALNFLSEFSTVSADLERLGSNASIRDAFGQMYGLETSNTSSLMTVLSDIWKLPVKIRSDVSAIGLEIEVFEPVILRLENVLAIMTLESTAYSVRRTITDELMRSLRMISSILNKDLPEPLLSREKINELLKDLTELENDIRAAEFDAAFTDNILHRANSIRYALEHYETLGPIEVIARVEQMFGGVIMQFESLTVTKKKSGVVGKMLYIGSAIVMALNTINGGFELSSNITTLIDSTYQFEGEVIDSIIDEPSSNIASKTKVDVV